tara:strand:+ start:1938 stop:3467 length:1530 start_codon:yes stop_codon:yes gene_type:complete
MMSSSDRKRRVLRCGQMGLTELLAAIVICLFYAKTVEEPRRLESQLKEIQSALSTLDELAAAQQPPAAPPLLTAKPAAVAAAPRTPRKALRPSAARAVVWGGELGSRAAAVKPPLKVVAASPGAAPPVATPPPDPPGTRYVRLQFKSSGKYLYIGMPLEFASGDEGACWGSAAPAAADPRTVFAVLPYPGADASSGDVTLRSLSSGRFLQVGVPGDAESGPKWVLRAVGTKAPGRSGRFQLKSNSKLYCVATQSFLNDVGGFVRFHSSVDPKDRPSTAGEGTTSLNIQWIAPGSAELAKYVALKKKSDGLIADATARGTAMRALLPSVGENNRPTRITLGVAMTSKGTEMRNVEDSPFFNVLLPSFIETTSAEIAQTSRWSFAIYASWDSGDPVYDASSGAHDRFRAAFAKQMRAAGLSPDAVTLKLFHPSEFQFPSGAPSQLVSKVLAIAALEHGADYLYQVNDDSFLNSAGWAPILCGKLRNNPFMPDLGVTGPSDTVRLFAFCYSF